MATDPTPATPVNPTPPATGSGPAETVNTKDSMEQGTMKNMGWKVWVLGIIGGLLLSGISNGVWEVIEKPAFAGIARVVLSVVTFGSEAAKNGAYRDAAMEPQSLPSHVLLIFFAAIAAVMIGISLGRSSKQLFGTTPTAGQPPPGKVALSQWWKSKWFSGIMICFCAFITGVLLLRIAAVSESVLIWRTFQTNLTICAPYMTQAEEKQFRSRFAAMTTHNEYEQLDADLETIAKKAGASLKHNPLW